MMPSKLDAAAALESMDSMDALQSKPLTTVPDEMRPAFDYSGLDAQTVDDLPFAESWPSAALSAWATPLPLRMKRCAELSQFATTLVMELVAICDELTTTSTVMTRSGRGACPSASPKIPLTGCYRWPP